MDKNIDTNLTLQLGDIIQIISPTDENLNDKMFYINYISYNKIVLLGDNLQEVILNINKYKKFTNESIERIFILSRSKSSSFALQNNLIPKNWIDIYFEGDLPTVVTGQITNLDEDQIEVKLLNDETIYIDFAYSGIPEELPIKKIILREKPETIDKIEDVIEDEIEKDEIEKDEIGKDEIEKDEYEDIEDEIEKDEYEDIEDEIEVKEQDEEDIKERIKNVILSADQIQFGDELSEITQLVEVSEEEKKYSIEKQTNNLLNEFLSTIPNDKRTSKVLNNIHKMIERYEQLREKFSIINDIGNVENKFVKGAKYKPLVNELKNFNNKLYWLLPIVTNNKDICVDDNELINVEELKMLDNINIKNVKKNEIFMEMEEITNNFKKNKSDDENSYNFFIKSLNILQTPFTNPVDGCLSKQKVNTNITALVSNNDDDKSVVINKSNLDLNKYYIQEYNLGLTKTYANINKLTGKRVIKRSNITEPDELCIKSLITLPISCVKFSNINQPYTNIMDKSNLNHNFINYWKFLNNKSIVNKEVIDNFENIDKNKNFIKNINQYILDKELYDDNDKYNKFINNIVPKTRDIFNLIKKTIKNGYSLDNIVNNLSPFMIDKDDITFMQYKDIINFINEEIKNYKKKYISSKRFLNKKRKNIINNYKSDILETLRENYELLDTLLKSYNIDLSNKTNSEIIQMCYDLDNMVLYNNIISKIDIDLIVNKEFNNLIEEKLLQEERKEEKKEEKEENLSTCKNILSKKYLALDELEADNDVDVVFDKIYDQTNYDYNDLYKNDLENLQSREEKLLFLINKLKDNIGMDKNVAIREAEALLNNYKLVVDGDYALLHLEETNQKHYYKRINKKWVKDEDINDTLFTEQNKLFCNLKTNCYMMNNKCDDMDTIEEKIDIETNNKILGEFKNELDNYYENINLKIDNNLLNSVKRLNMLKKIKTNKLFKYDINNYRIGLNSKDIDVIKSPHEKLLNQILSQGDFIKKQKNLIKFKLLYTREPQDNENKWWLYCVNSNVMLVPTFILRLADVFVKGENYLFELQKIISEQGVLSGDGNYVVDKYSGWIINKQEFDITEGYTEEGFKIKSRDMLEADIGNSVVQSIEEKKSESKYENEQSEKIYNISKTMLNFIGIENNSIIDFVVSETSNLLSKNMPSEEAYNINIKKKKGKKKPSYEFVYNQTLLLITLSLLLIGIQTNIPDIKTKKNFPGCFKSFKGYPTLGEEDKSSINYIACIANKIKSNIVPWNTLKKLNQNKIVDKMVMFINNIILNTEIIKNKITEKIIYNKQNVNIEFPDEHSINNWTTFLPPLKKIKINEYTTLSVELKRKLLKDIETGNSDQDNKINVIRSKIIYLSLLIGQSIENIVHININKNLPILINSLSEPFLENACCNDENISTIDYFMNRDSNIERYNNETIELRKILNQINLLSKAKIIYDNENTKRKYPLVTNEFTRDTIYRAFTYYCNYDSNIEISEYLTNICRIKPDNYDKDANLENKIKILNENGIEYNLEELNKLLNLVNKNNMKKLNYVQDNINNVVLLKEILNEINEVDDETFPRIFINNFIDLLDNFERNNLKKDTIKMRDMKNYLSSSNSEMEKFIKKFIEINTTNENSNFIIECIMNITNFDIDPNNIDEIDNVLFNTFNYITNSINNIINVYPIMIINNSINNEQSIPKHWGLSKKHSGDIKNIIKKYYKSLNKLINDDNKIMNMILTKINSFKYIVKLVQNTKYIAPIEINNEVYYSIFDRRLCLMLYKFYFLTTLFNIINLINDKDILNKNIIPTQSIIELSFTEQLINDTYDDEELELVSGIKKDVSSKLVSIIESFLEIICSNKNNINYNYKNLNNLIIKSKDKEKNIITDYLKDLSDENREIENMYKLHKLGKWSVGEQKGFRVYQKETYDYERDKLIDDSILEMKLGKNDIVTDMNRDIFMIDELYEQQNIKEIENEVYDISHLGEDNDNFGEFEESEY